MSVDPGVPEPADGGSTPTGEAGNLSIVSVRPGTLAQPASLEELPPLLLDQGSTVWIDLTDPSGEQVHTLASMLGVHPVVIEDIVESDGRSKLEAVDEVLHIVLFALTRGDVSKLHEVDFILGRRFPVDAMFVN